MKLDRYQRHELIDWFPSEVVKNAQFAIIGCGAVGNEVAKNLALLGVGHLSLYDFDKIELHNLTRSVLFRESDVGRSKAEVAATRSADLDPNIRVEYHHGDFWDTLSLDEVRGLDGVICCVDNFEARLKLSRLTQITSVNLINTGIDSRYAVVEVFPFSSKSGYACYECNLPDSAYERMRQRYSCGWLKRVAFIEKKIPTTIVTSSACGAIAASHALRLLAENQASDSSRVLLDTISGSSTVSTLELNPSCPTCSAYQKPIHLVAATNLLDEGLLKDLDLPENISVLVSDPILLSHRCTNCTPEENEATVVFRRATDFDTDITFCKDCNDESVSVDIADMFSLGDLLRDYSGLRIPSKFAQVETDSETIVINLEGAS